MTGDENRELIRQASIQMAIEVSDMQNEIVRHHRDLQAISMICADWRDNITSAEDCMRMIQGIAG